MGAANTSKLGEIMQTLSLLQKERLRYQPTLPPFLKELNTLDLVPLSIKKPQALSPAIQKQFPLTHEQPILQFQRGKKISTQPLKVGVVFSGGQAPGGHNVITGLFDALKQLEVDSTLLGFLDGPNGLVKNNYLELTADKLASYRNQGGFDLMGSGRTKIETAEQFEAVEKTLRAHALDGLVIIGGDDSNTNAAFLAEFCRKRQLTTRIVGVPKTIDGDLKNEWIEISFGFDTAAKVYAEIIGNLLRDALSAKKYYFFVKMMGRSASHLTLECALQTQVNLALISEEVAARQQSLTEVVQQIADLICERAEQGKNYGVCLIPEGLLEFMPDCQKMLQELNQHLTKETFQTEDFARRLQGILQDLTPEAATCLQQLPEDIQKQLLLDRDPHGNVQVSKIETERLLMALVEKELNQRKQVGKYKGTFNPQPFFCGYEGRSALPSNFDATYCYALGHVAAILIQKGASGYISCVRHLAQPVEAWEPYGIPIVDLLHLETRKGKQQLVIKKAFVDLEGAAFITFAQKREKWRLEDLYCMPGPIQFEGGAEIANAPPLSLIL